MIWVGITCKQPGYTSLAPEGDFTWFWFELRIILGIAQCDRECAKVFKQQLDKGGFTLFGSEVCLNPRH